MEYRDKIGKIALQITTQIKQRAELDSFYTCFRWNCGFRSNIYHRTLQQVRPTKVICVTPCIFIKFSLIHQQMHN